MKNIFLLLLVTSILFISCKNESSPDNSTSLYDIENGLLKAIQIKGETPKKLNILERMKFHNVPGVSIAVVENGSIAWAKGFGIANSINGNEVNHNTLFQAGSISKPIAALAALKLVENGEINLDTDVNSYLKGWRIPDSKFTSSQKVTIRRLLTHTAGMTVHGFPGYKQTDTFPSIETVLNGKGNTGPIVVDTIPGSIWRYSGGGFTVMEKVVEDVSGLSLQEYMSKFILKPMDMNNSTFDQPLLELMHDNASAAYDGEGNIIEGLWHNYPEQAAAGLWTTPTDLAKYCIEIQNILNEDYNGVLSKDMVEKMLSKDKNDWGLGVSLQGEKDSLVFQHGGKNAGFTNDMMAFAYKGKAVIIMTNADNGSRLIDEIFRAISSHYKWNTHNPREVAIIELDDEELHPFTGKFVLDFQVPDIGDYLIDITIKDHKLYVMDPNNGDSNLLTPQDSLKFIDLDKGDQIQFQIENSKVNGLLWSGRFQFNRVEE